MIVQPLVSSTDAVANLPMWWRCALVALGTIILCSCAAPAVSTAPVNAAAEAPRSITRTDLKADGSIVRTKLPTGSPSTCPCCGPAGCVPSGVDPAEFGLSEIDPYGPIVGPSDEYLCDGGDFGTPAGVRADWIVEGVEEEDAISHYDTVDGRVVVTPSNRVCIYAPRFAAVRRVVGPIAHEQPVYVNAILEEESAAKAAESQPVVSSLHRKAIAINLGERPASLFRQRQQAGGLENLLASMDAYTSLAAYANLEIIRTGTVSDAEKPLVEKSVESAVTWTGDQGPQVAFGVKMALGMDSVRQAGIVYQTDEPNSPRLRLLKLASRGHALPGEEVEFTLRFDNVGDQVIGNVTIVDNLSTRLEYVPESAKSSVDATFVTEPNATESSILRWEIKDPVEPGDGGILRFRTKVR